MQAHPPHVLMRLPGGVMLTLSESDMSTLRVHSHPFQVMQVCRGTPDIQKGEKSGSSYVSLGVLGGEAQFASRGSQT